MWRRPLRDPPSQSFSRAISRSQHNVVRTSIPNATSPSQYLGQVIGVIEWNQARCYDAAQDSDIAACKGKNIHLQLYIRKNALVLKFVDNMAAKRGER